MCVASLRQATKLVQRRFDFWLVWAHACLLLPRLLPTDKSFFFFRSARYSLPRHVCGTDTFIIDTFEVKSIGCVQRVYPKLRVPPRKQEEEEPFCVIFYISFLIEAGSNGAVWLIHQVEITGRDTRFRCPPCRSECCSCVAVS